MSGENQTERKSVGTSRANKLWLALGGLLLSLLLAAVFTLGSLQIPFEPDRWNEVLLLFALSTFIVALFVVFLFVFLRTLLRTWLERRAGQLGARFRTKMVAGAMGISLLPVVFMFFASYGLLNRTLNRWFPRPLEIAAEENQKLLNTLGKFERERLESIAWQVSDFTPTKDRSQIVRAFELGADAVWLLSPEKMVLEVAVRVPENTDESRGSIGFVKTTGHFKRTLPSGLELWEAKGTIFLAARHTLREFSHPLLPKKSPEMTPPRRKSSTGTKREPMEFGTVIVGRRVSDDFQRALSEIETQVAAYNQQKQGLRTLKNQMLLALSLFAVLLLFSSTWAALFLAKQVTVPIQALAEGTKAVSAGNFDHRVEVPAQDELGALVTSFNQMTAQLGDSRRQIDDFTRSLQDAVQELERRRKLMEVLLENIPTAVISLDEHGHIIRANPAVVAMFGESARDPGTLVNLVNEETARGIQLLMRKALRMGTASREMEIALPGRVLRAAVTVSSLGPRRANPGYILVIDDLSELLRAQKSAAWQEVAQRIAHEIKNPLTPIQLSIQRLQRYLERSHEAGHPQNRELEKLVSECAGLMQGEVTALKTLVDEFSQFARFPAPKTIPADLNSIVSSAVEVFRGRLDGVTIHTELAADLPAVRADEELLRRVLVNLVDNAVEAMEGSTLKELRIETARGRDSDTLNITVADTGHGISPEDKDKLFLPHFSTKDRGTGLGLAIVGRIVAEHGGVICVEDNLPMGSRFIIRLPVAEAAAETASGVKKENSV